jgi:hypothetical protein
MTRLAPIALVAATLVLAGCYGPRGAIYPYSGNGYTYVSTEMKPVTITLFDTRTDEPFFKMATPCFGPIAWSTRSWTLAPRPAA